MRTRGSVLLLFLCAATALIGGGGVTTVDPPGDSTGSGVLEFAAATSDPDGTACDDDSDSSDDDSDSSDDSDSRDGPGVADAWLRVHQAFPAEFVVFGADRTQDGGWILVGQTSAPGEPTERLWVARLDTAGSIVWQKRYAGGSATVTPGAPPLPEEESTSRGFAVRALSGGDFIVAGASLPALPWYVGGPWILRLGPDGHVVWERVVPSTAAALPTHWTRVVPTPDGGFVVTGLGGYAPPDPFDGSLTTWVLKLTADGNGEWSRSRLPAVVSATETGDGGVLLGGFHERSPRLLRLEPDGTIPWDEWMDLEGLIASAVPTSDGGTIVGGSFAAGGVWAAKLDSGRRVEWGVDLGGLHAGRARPTPDGGYVVSSLHLLNLGLVKLDASGHPTWQRSYALLGSLPPPLWDDPEQVVPGAEPPPLPFSPVEVRVEPSGTVSAVSHKVGIPQTDLVPGFYWLRVDSGGHLPCGCGGESDLNESSVFLDVGTIANPFPQAYGPPAAPYAMGYANPSVSDTSAVFAGICP